MQKEGDGTYNDHLLEVHQKFLAHREVTNLKLQKLEELLEIAVQQVKLRQGRQTPLPQEDFVNPFSWNLNEMPEIKVSNKSKETDTPKHLKLQFPRYVESSEVEEWLEACEVYFDICGIEGQKKIKISGLHLEGRARSWYQVCVAEQMQWSWEEFCYHMKMRFGSMEQETAMLHQEGDKSIPQMQVQYQKDQLVMAQKGKISDNQAQKEELELQTEKEGNGGISQEDNGSLTPAMEVFVHAIAGVPKYDDYPDEEEADGNATEVVLSALGINELKHNQPTQFPRICCNRSIRVLIDSESNLNLVTSRICTDLGLPLEPQPPISITLPNGEVQEWWPEKEFISAALEGGEPKSPNSCERSEGGDDLVYIQVIQDNLYPYCPEFEDFSHIWKQVCILIWPKEEIAKSLANKTKKASGYGGRN